eukprot:TRINITY_DN21592_c0_g1_i2.p1 TRINITY_DN21592_c0_g1~~TRINITY_DN21592_c0_g1_i2.p1  ORF type:complete len:328 (+),score=88.59 TRINITY_DN21592_c0_g1_i2:334-1317(+)
MPNKEEGPLREAFLNSASREVAFYSDLAARCAAEAAAEASGTATPDVFRRVRSLWPVYHNSHADAANTEFLLVLEDMHHSGYTQSPNVSESRMKNALSALAIFHAAYWGCPNVLSSERGCFWPLYKRSAAERSVETASLHWETVRGDFPQLDPTIASRLASRAAEIDKAVEQSSFTRVHGDCKGPNLFFRDLQEGAEASLDQQVRFIDAQWTGLGNPFSDVANLLTAGLEVDLLPRFDEFFAFYEEALLAALPESARQEYLNKVQCTWDLCWLDYCRVAMLGLWRNLSLAKLERAAKDVGASMINRSIPHIEFIGSRVKQKLDEKGW